MVCPSQIAYSFLHSDVKADSSFSCMEAAYNAGINFFDCAEGYSGGESEVVMGKAIKHFGWKRSDLVISTKIYFGTVHGKNPVNNGGLSRKHIIEGTNGALERLQLDYGQHFTNSTADADVRA